MSVHCEHVPSLTCVEANRHEQALFVQLSIHVTPDASVHTSRNLCCRRLENATLLLAVIIQHTAVLCKLYVTH